MKNLHEKFKVTIGWLLLFVGIVIIGHGLFSAYQVFQGTESAPEIFTSNNDSKNDLPQVIKKSELEEALARVLENILPLEDIPAFLNILTFSVFIFILFAAGFKISTLGIKLLFNERKKN